MSRLHEIAVIQELTHDTMSGADLLYVEKSSNNSDAGIKIEELLYNSRIEGLENAIDAIKNNAADPENDIDISAGISCFASDAKKFMGVSSATTREIDAEFGTGNGGMYVGGSVSANTTYHLFMIKKDSDGSLNYYFDTSVTAANIPTGYTHYRRLWSVITDASSNILQFIQFGKYCKWKVSVNNYNDDAPNTNRQTQLITAPLGIISKVKIMGGIYSETVGVYRLKIRELIETDSSGTDLDCDLSAAGGQTVDSDPVISENAIIEIFTNTLSQIGWRINAIASVFITTIGYEDFNL